MNKNEMRDWMNFYHDKWIDAHNKLNEVKRIIK